MCVVQRSLKDIVENKYSRQARVAVVKRDDELQKRREHKRATSQLSGFRARGNYTRCFRVEWLEIHEITLPPGRFSSRTVPDAADANATLESSTRRERSVARESQDRKYVLPLLNYTQIACITRISLFKRDYIGVHHSHPSVCMFICLSVCLSVLRTGRSGRSCSPDRAHFGAQRRSARWSPNRIGSNRTAACRTVSYHTIYRTVPFGTVPCRVGGGKGATIARSANYGRVIIGVSARHRAGCTRTSVIVIRVNVNNAVAIDWMAG